MFDEEIILLIKEDKHKEAIQRYVDGEKYQKAEEFCVNKDRNQNLNLTTLLTIYFQYYEENQSQYDILVNNKKIQDSFKFKEKADKYRDLALSLMRNHSAKNQLDPLIVLNLIPENWELKTNDYNLLSFLSSIFDHQMTIEENSKIGKNLSKMECLNAEHELNELKTAYLVI